MTIRDGQERVAKLIAQLGWCSRREAERLISAGQVLVDGVVVRDQGVRVRVDANITLKDRGKQHLADLVTVILHKPTGIVSTQPEGDQIPAWQLLTRENCLTPNDPAVEEVLRQPWTCAVCGRLDQNSRGLLVLSQDGKLARLITGGHAWEKHYAVTVDGVVKSEHVRQLLALRRIERESILPMQVEHTGANSLRFILREGRKHQIRRACLAVGLKVTDLVRYRVGPWELGDGPENTWRIMPRAEVVALIAGKADAEERNGESGKSENGSRKKIEREIPYKQLPTRKFNTHEDLAADDEFTEETEPRKSSRTSTPISTSKAPRKPVIERNAKREVEGKRNPQRGR
jgi:23S rRNA pseudouridine2604 synthase